MRKLFIFLFFFIFCIGITFAYDVPFGNISKDVHIGNMTFTLPNRYIIFSNAPDGTVFCGNNMTGEIITFLVRSLDKDIDLDSNEAIKAVVDVAKELNSNILKIERFDLNGRIIIVTREQDNYGKVVKAYFFIDKKLYLIEFTQKPMSRYGYNYVEDYEQARSLLFFLIDSAR